MEQIGKKGEKFKAEIHSAIENIQTDNIKDDQIIAEIKLKGYKIGEKIIREAKVKVFEFKK